MSENNVILNIKNLNKKFNNTEILKNINLEVNKSEVVVILGPSGCGKSTLLRCINKLEIINSGEIIFNNINIHDKNINIKDIRQKIGMVFQSYDLFDNMNVLKNITLGPIKVQKRDKEEVINYAKELLKKVKLEGYENRLPKELSGGQRQRVAIIRALAMDPEIILFDEVTAALDPEMVQEVLEVIADLAIQNRTLIIVTHEMNFARKVADRIIFMDEGNIVEENNPKDFFKKPKTVRAQQFLNKFNY